MPSQEAKASKAEKDRADKEKKQAAAEGGTDGTENSGDVHMANGHDGDTSANGKGSTPPGGGK
jgi:hypothetical protein